jgi:hypothetical protein
MTVCAWFHLSACRGKEQKPAASPAPKKGKAPADAELVPHSPKESPKAGGGEGKKGKGQQAAAVSPKGKGGRRSRSRSRSRSPARERSSGGGAARGPKLVERDPRAEARARGRTKDVSVNPNTTIAGACTLSSFLSRSIVHKLIPHCCMPNPFLKHLVCLPDCRTRIFRTRC